MLKSFHKILSKNEKKGEEMKLNLKNLALPISIITIISGNCSDVTDKLNNNIIPLIEEENDNINNMNEVNNTNNNHINTIQNNNNNNPLQNNGFNFVQNGVLLNSNNNINNNTLLGNKRKTGKNNNINEIQNTTNNKINIKNQNHNITNNISNSVAQNNTINNTTNNTVTDEEINKIKQKVSNWLNKFMYRQMSWTVFESLTDIYSQNDYTFKYALQLKNLSKYDTTGIIKLLGIYTNNEKKHWSETLKNDLVTSNWFSNNKDNIRNLIEFVYDSEIESISKYQMLLRKNNNIEILRNEIKQNYSKYVELFYNMQLYLLQKIHGTIFNHNYNNENFDSLLECIQHKFMKHNADKDNRRIILNTDERTSLIEWLIYCDINKHMYYSKTQYKTLLGKYKDFVFPTDITSIQTISQINQLGSYPAKSLLSFYTDEIDHKINETSNNDDKHNIIKEYVNELISGQEYKVSNQQNLTQERKQEKIQKLAGYMLSESYFDAILSLVSKLKFKQNDKHSFIEDYNKITEQYKEEHKKYDGKIQKYKSGTTKYEKAQTQYEKAREKYQKGCCANKIKLISVIRHVFKSVKKDIYTMLCNKYHITPDNEFINGKILNDQHFANFMRSFSIMEKINKLFKISDDDNVSFKNSIIKDVLFCSKDEDEKKNNLIENKLNTDIIEDNNIVENITKDKDNQSIEKNNILNEVNKENTGKDLLKSVRSNYIIAQIFSHLYDNNTKNETNI